MKSIKKDGKMATKHKSPSGLISLTKPASKKLAGILSAPQTQTQKETIQRAKGIYAYHSAKWKNPK